jgi:mono/diheme cytochrome c family protein
MRPSKLVVTAVLLTFSMSVSGQTTGGQKPPTIAIDSLAGRDSFELYCAACHGVSGRGDGPVAAQLRARPADLTSLARRSGGAFPADQVRDFIVGTGRALPAHGTTEMPVWGPMFRAFESDARARERIGNLVAYIESIQLPSTGPGDSGNQLFRTYCATCHGANARGNGPLADQLRNPPPDLTQFTRRNGGVFPRERVYRIIDGRDVPSHGDRDMPVWGDIFKTMSGNSIQAAVKARIDAIVRYLEGIQERPA